MLPRDTLLTCADDLLVNLGSDDVRQRQELIETGHGAIAMLVWLLLAPSSPLDPCAETIPQCAHASSMLDAYSRVKRAGPTRRSWLRLGAASCCVRVRPPRRGFQTAAGRGAQSSSQRPSPS